KGPGDWPVSSMESWALVVLLQRTHPACPLCRVPSLRDAIARRSMPPRDKRTEQDTIRQKLSYGGWTGQPKRRKKVPRAVFSSEALMETVGAFAVPAGGCSFGMFGGWVSFPVVKAFVDLFSMSSRSFFCKI
ncbi:mCG146224, partial [Mus musculus]